MNVALSFGLGQNKSVCVVVFKPTYCIFLFLPVASWNSNSQCVLLLSRRTALSTVFNSWDQNTVFKNSTLSQSWSTVIHAGCARFRNPIALVHFVTIILGPLCIRYIRSLIIIVDDLLIVSYRIRWQNKLIKCLIAPSTKVLL